MLPALASVDSRKLDVFPVYGMGSRFPLGIPVKAGCSRSRMFLFQGFPQHSFSLDRLAAGASWRWLSLPQARSPHERLLPSDLRQAVSSFVIPFPGLPGGGLFSSSDRWFQTPICPLPLSRQPAFVALQPRGVKRSPHITYVMWFSGFALPFGLACPAEHITILASRNASTLFLKNFQTFFVDTGGI